MKYHVNAKRIRLEALRERIVGTDLVPSRGSLREEIDLKLGMLESHGITSLADLRKELSSSRRLERLSEATGIDEHYLILLRREIEGYFPKPCALGVFEWLPKEDIAILEAKGIRDTASLFDAATIAGSMDAMATVTGVDLGFLREILELADLSRIQWVSPNLARMLLAAGYPSVSGVAAADAGQLFEDLVRVNQGHRFFKGNIGLRDIKRLIKAASDLLRWQRVSETEAC